MQFTTIATFLLLAAASLAQNVIPSGTILPVKLNTSLNSKKSKAGQEVHGGLAQDVPLASGFTIPAGAKLGGHVIVVTRASGGRGARLSFQFDTLQIGRGTVSLTASLRAIASMMEVHEAQLPATGPDHGTPQTAWVTQQIGGETNYHGGWPVTNGPDIVGKSLLSGGVWVRISSAPWTQCRDQVDHPDQPQALWVFASDACGSYGFEDLTIAQMGQTDPVGQIVLASQRQEIDIRGGSGMLLRVISSTR